MIDGRRSDVRPANLQGEAPPLFCCLTAPPFSTEGRFQGHHISYILWGDCFTVVCCPTACGGKVVPQAPKGEASAASCLPPKEALINS